MTANCQGNKEGLDKTQVTGKTPLTMKSPWMMLRKSLPKRTGKKLSGLIITRDQCVQFPATLVRVAHGYCPAVAGLEGF